MGTAEKSYNNNNWRWLNVAIKIGLKIIEDGAWEDLLGFDLEFKCNYWLKS